MVKETKMKEADPLVIPIGDVRGVVVTMAVSRKSRMSLIKDEFGDGDHIALSTEGKFTWTSRPDVCGEDLTAHFRYMLRTRPEYMNAAFWRLYPEYEGTPLCDFGIQTGANDEFSAERTDIHAHVILARKATWNSGAIPRFVEPLVPIPVADRKPRNEKK